MEEPLLLRHPIAFFDSADADVAKVEVKAKAKAKAKVKVRRDLQPSVWRRTPVAR